MNLVYSVRLSRLGDHRLTTRRDYFSQFAKIISNSLPIETASLIGLDVPHAA